MPRRSPSSLLHLAAGAVAVLFAAAALAQPPAAPAAAPAAAAPPAKSGDDVKRSAEDNQRTYKRFADELLKLAQRWEKSDNPDEKARAKTLRSALEIGEKRGVENLFKGVVSGLLGAKSGPEFEALTAKDRELVKALEEILETLDTEDESERLKKEIRDLEALIKEVARLKREEETLMARTNVPKSDLEKLAKDQARVAKETQKLAEQMAKKDPKATSPTSAPRPPADDMAEPKPDAKPGEGGGEPKPDGKDAKGQGQGAGKGTPKPAAKPGEGGESKPGDSPPSDSPPSGSKPGSGKPGSGKPGGPRPPNPNNPNDEAQRSVEEAVPPQEQAEEELKKNDRPTASKNEAEAIKKLEAALRELEKRLKQLREKEMLKKLEDLERRVTKMLRMQVEVYDTTKLIDGAVKRNKNEPTSADRQRSQVEGDKESLIVEEADKALRLLEGEGTAVVFAGVLLEARKDMEAVQKQLLVVNVGSDTQLVEEQIIEQLKRMLEALKKAKQDLQNPPPPPKPGDPPPEAKKNLIQLVEQLKLLKELQLLVNKRTTAFGAKTPTEQANDPFVREQLRQLGDRQKVLQDMLQKIAAQLTQQ